MQDTSMSDRREEPKMVFSTRFLNLPLQLEIEKYQCSNLQYCSNNERNKIKKDSDLLCCYRCRKEFCGDCLSVCDECTHYICDNCYVDDEELCRKCYEREIRYQSHSNTYVPYQNLPKIYN